MMMLSTVMQVYARDETPPPVELLDFIGQGILVDSEVIDPLSLKGMDAASGHQSDQDGHDRRDQSKPARTPRQQKHD